jgi:hypothetical protein
VTVNFFSPCTGSGSSAVSKTYDFSLDSVNVDYNYNLTSVLQAQCPGYTGTFSTVVQGPIDATITDDPVNL